QAAGHGGPALAQARRRPAPPPGASGGEVQRRHHAGAARSRRAEGGRLITLDPQHLTIALRRTRCDSRFKDIMHRRLWITAAVFMTQAGCEAGPTGTEEFASLSELRLQVAVSRDEVTPGDALSVRVSAYNPTRKAVQWPE